MDSMLARRVRCWPAAVQAIIEAEHASTQTIGQSGAELLLVSGKNGQQTAVKFQRRGAGLDLASEAERLIWFRKRCQQLPIPRVLHYERSRGVEWLVMERLPGDQCQRHTGWGTSVGQALAYLHQQDPSECPYMASTSQRLIRDLTTRLAALPEAAQPQDWRAQLATASEVLLSQPDVPVHGDCCLPNLLVDDQRSVSGIVDWAYGGIANAHWDWFYLRGSCERNGLLDEWPAIIDGYGSAPDKQALNAVEIIDDLMGALE